MASKESFLDGCHKYGWIINIIVTIFLVGAAWGSLKSTVYDLRSSQEDLKSRIVRIENVLLCGKIDCR